jgi:hypothetical protein
MEDVRILDIDDFSVNHLWLYFYLFYDMLYMNMLEFGIYIKFDE